MNLHNPNPNEPTNLQLLVAEVKKSASSSYHGGYIQVPFRIEFASYTRLEALVKHTGSSRNKIMNDLLRIGIETLAASLDDETIKTLFEIETSITADLYASGKIKSGDQSDD
jgi:hypothetical protein